MALNDDTHKALVEAWVELKRTELTRQMDDYDKRLKRGDVLETMATLLGITDYDFSNVK